MPSSISKSINQLDQIIFLIVLICWRYETHSKSVPIEMVFACPSDNQLFGLSKSLDLCWSPPLAHEKKVSSLKKGQTAASVVRLLNNDDLFSIEARNSARWFGCEHVRKSVGSLELP